VSRSPNGSNVTGFLAQVGGMKRKALLVGHDTGPREAEQQALGVVERDLRIAQPCRGIGEGVYRLGRGGDAVRPRQGADGGSDLRRVVNRVSYSRSPFADLHCPVGRFAVAAGTHRCLVLAPE